MLLLLSRLKQKTISEQFRLLTTKFIFYRIGLRLDVESLNLKYLLDVIQSYTSSNRKKNTYDFLHYEHFNSGKWLFYLGKFGFTIFPDLKSKKII
jgi:hypothetical protein